MPAIDLVPVLQQVIRQIPGISVPVVTEGFRPQHFPVLLNPSHYRLLIALRRPALHDHEPPTPGGIVRQYPVAPVVGRSRAHPAPHIVAGITAVGRSIAVRPRGQESLDPLDVFEFQPRQFRELDDDRLPNSLANHFGGVVQGRRHRIVIQGRHQQFQQSGLAAALPANQDRHPVRLDTRLVRAGHGRRQPAPGRGPIQFGVGRFQGGNKDLFQPFPAIPGRQGFQPMLKRVDAPVVQVCQGGIAPNLIAEVSRRGPGAAIEGHLGRNPLPNVGFLEIIQVVPAAAVAPLDGVRAQVQPHLQTQ